MRRISLLSAWLLLAGLALSPAPGSAQAREAEVPKIKAPTLIYPEPAVYLLLHLPGDLVNVRYTPGSLDRAANLQYRLELASRTFKRSVDSRLEIDVYVLSREEWRQARYDVPYGVPVRVGTRALAAPAEGDDGTVQLWSGLLRGMLPAVAGSPIRGTPQQAATMILADFLAQLLVSEILVDEVGIAGNQQWVRGLMTHVASVEFVKRHEESRLRDLDAMYGLLAQHAGPRAFSAREYAPDLGFGDWLWFQAQFHAGAQTIVAKEGKGSLKKMKKMRGKAGGVLSDEQLLRRYDALDEWFYASFTTVSLRR